MPIHAPFFLALAFAWLILSCPASAGAEPSASQTVKVEIGIEGLDGVLLKNARALLSLEQYKTHQRLSEQQIKHFFRRGAEEIRLALEPFGYYQAKVESDLSAPAASGQPWQATYRVQPGPPVKLGTVDIQFQGESRDDPEFQQFLQAFPLRSGGILNQVEYAEAKQNLESLASERGYLDARFARASLQVQPEQQRADLLWVFDSGPRYRFGEVQFNPEASALFNETLLRSFQNFTAGEPFTYDTLAAYRQALLGSGYFSHARTELVKQADSLQLLLKVDLGIRKPNRYRFRLGYGTDTSARARASWERQYFTRKGHRMRADIYAALNKKQLLGEYAYFIPYNWNERHFFKLFTRYEGEDYDFNQGFGEQGQDAYRTIRAQDFSLGIKQFRRYQWLGFDLEEHLGLEYRFSQANLLEAFPADLEQEIRAFAPHWVPVLENEYRLLIPSISLRYQQVDNPVYSRHGSEATLRLSGAREGLGSNVDFLQLYAQGKWIRAVGAGKRLILRGEAAYTDAEIVDLAGIPRVRLPASLLFLTGGDRSIRGYRFENLDGGSDARGARHLLVASLEYEQEIIPDWSVAAFADGGNVFNDYNDIELKYSVGTGLRWRSPIGLIRLDVGFALREDGKPYTIHLNIGPDFYDFADYF